MKKIQYLLTVGLLSLFVVLVSSCGNDFLDTEPLDKISSDATWSDEALAEAFVFGVYSYLGYGGFEEQGLSSFTDEAMFTHAGRPIPPLNEGTESPTNLAYMSPTYNWDDMYLAIRQANIALTELANSPISQAAKDRLTGEAHFLRAYYYQQLLRFYGGVPIIDQPYGLGEDYEVARSSYSDVVDFIISDLDAAAGLLDGKPETAGRASRLAALVLKARVLVYAASDLHEASKVPNAEMGGELFAYSGGQSGRWQAAKTAAKAALDAGVGYKLDLSSPVSAEEGKQNYVSLAMGGGSAMGDAAATVELILQRTATVDYTEESRWPLGGLHHGINNGPNGYNNWGGNTPIQQLVDDYEMMDGSSFDWSNEDHAEAPYDNRDPRFYATILYDGADWKPRPAAVSAIDPSNQIQTGYYDDGNGGIINGVDTRESVIENWNGSRTHYYTRKFTDPDPSLADNLSTGQTIPFPFIRYTEVVLNYVETCLETGDEATAQEWLNRIRFRAGMPAVDDSGQALVDRYRNERRIELAYEEHRYHDARRWLIAPETLGRGIQAINIQAKLKPGATPHNPYRYDPEVYDYEYAVFDNTEVETRTWVDKMYYRPINRDEINRNMLLEQNPGY
ncbi:MAG: RagB/SusD family nutrient uptake outer membrane protein [Bacteroidota bacterium]